MIKNICLFKNLKESFTIRKNKKYTILYKKFNRRFPQEFVPQLLDNINNEFVDSFVAVMKENNKDKYLENLYSNLSNSKIINNKKMQNRFLGKEEYGGNIITKRNYYLILGDKEYLKENKALLTPYHELFHLLTTKLTDDNTIRIGFQINDFAHGINEGYTEYITKKYFVNTSKDDFDAYYHFSWFIDMLNDIVGENDLERLYLEANLEGLISELKKYIPEENVIELIEDIDLLFDSEDKLFDYQKQFLYQNKKLDNKVLDEFYSINKNIMDKIYNTFITINESKEKINGIKTNFKEKNDLIKKKFDKDEETYHEYFTNDYKDYLKK